jgi:hypothetical protein
MTDPIVTPATTTKPTTATKQPQQPKYTAVNFRSADGSRLALYARVMRDGFRAGAEHASPPNGTGKRTYSRGATSQHATMAEALAQRDKLAEAAVKAGWTRPVGPVHVARPDAFDAANLPKPVGAKAPAGKTK